MYKNLSAVSIMLMLASCSSATRAINANNDNRRAAEKINSFNCEDAQINGNKFSQKINWGVRGNAILTINNKLVNFQGKSFYIFNGEVGKVYKASLTCGSDTRSIELGKDKVGNVLKNSKKRETKTAQQYVDSLRSGEKIDKEALNLIVNGINSDISKVKGLIDKLEGQLEKKIIEKSRKEIDEISKRLESFKILSLDASKLVLGEIKEINHSLKKIIDDLKSKAEKAKLNLDNKFKINLKVIIPTSSKKLKDALNLAEAQNHNLNLEEFKKIFKNLSKVDEKEINESVKEAINTSTLILKESEDNKRDLTASEIKTLVDNYNFIIEEVNLNEYYINKLTFKRASKKLTKATLTSEILNSDLYAEEQPNEFVLFLKEIGLMDFIKSIFGELFDWGLDSLNSAINNKKSVEKFRVNFAKRGTENLRELKQKLILAQSYVKNYQEVFGKSENTIKLATNIDSALEDIKKILEDSKDKIEKNVKAISDEIQQSAIKIQNEIIDFLIKHSKLAQQNVNKFFNWLQEKVEAGNKTFEELFDDIIAKLESSKKKDSGLNDQEIILLVKIQAFDLKTILEDYKTQNPEDKSYDNLLKLINKIIDANASNSEDMVRKIEKYRVEKSRSKNNSPSVSRKNSAANLNSSNSSQNLTGSPNSKRK